MVLSKQSYNLIVLYQVEMESTVASRRAAHIEKKTDSACVLVASYITKWLQTSYSKQMYVAWYWTRCIEESSKSASET